MTTALMETALTQTDLPEVPEVWTAVCRFSDLEPGRGVAALVGGDQVALFRLGDGALHAVGNIDPFSGAAVISRGLTGMRSDGVVTVASPMYKDVFSLITGTALEAPEVVIPVYSVRRHRGLVWIGPEVTSGFPEDAARVTDPTRRAHGLETPAA